MVFRSIPIAIASASLFGCGKGTPASGDSAVPTTSSAAAPIGAAESAGPQAAQAAQVNAPSGPPSFGPDVDPPEAQQARADLVRRIERGGTPWEGSSRWDARVLDAVRRTPRHLFMPGAPIRLAYGDHPNPIGHGQTISQPTVVAIMTDAIDLTGAERVLEIGTGSGYQAAVLSVLAREVYSIEIVEELGNTAKKRLAELGYKNVHVRVGDGYKGSPESAPFDRILLTAAPPEIPEALVNQLKDGGILVAPVGEETAVQRLVRWKKRGSELAKEDLGAVRFVPMVKEIRDKANP
jgi:protein-L-isoaspartate(D-aspartate) O-methyltransferase